MTALQDWTLLVTDIGEHGVSRTRDATAEERLELARELDIPSCESLSARYDVKPLGSGRYRFAGTLAAEVTQPCVVTLEPVPARISEEFSIELAPPELVEEPTPSGEREVSTVADVEPIEDGRIEVGTLIFAILSSALPPYPRKEGAAFDWVDPKIAADSDSESPFAGLAKLKPPKS